MDYPEDTTLKKDRALNIYDVESLARLRVELDGWADIKTEIDHDAKYGQPEITTTGIAEGRRMFMRFLIPRSDSTVLTGEMIMARELYVMIKRLREKIEIDALLAEHRKAVKWIALIYQGWRLETGTFGYPIMMAGDEPNGKSYERLGDQDDKFVRDAGWIEYVNGHMIQSEEGARIAGMYMRWYGTQALGGRRGG